MTELTEPKRPGRPAYVHGKRRCLYVSDAEWERLEHLGAGNRSQGLRLAIKIALKTLDTLPEKPETA